MAFYLSDNRYSGVQVPGESDYPRGANPAPPVSRSRISGRWDSSLPYIVNVAQGNDPATRGQGIPGPALPEGNVTNRPTGNPYGITDANFENYNQGINEAQYEGRRYLGGFPDDYVSKTYADVPYGSDNLSLRYWADQRRPMKKPAYGKPVYREGMEATFASNLSPSGIRSWQGFFQAQGFKTGPAGFWTAYEMDAMRAFMAMANGVPGGGMTVDVLRSRIMADPRMQPGSLAAMLNAPENELSTGDGGGGGGGGTDPAELLPYTETTVERQVTEFSLDQGLTLLRGELAKQIGRPPTDGELARYVKGINAAARADPTVITTVVTTNPAEGSVDTERTVDETAVDPQGAAIRFGEEVAPEERQEYQGNRYMEALLSELGA